MEEIFFPYDIYYNLISRNDNASFSKLFSAEKEFMPNPIYARTTLYRAFRGVAITFMELNSVCEKFDAFIPYLAMTYVDRFVSARDIPNVIPGSRSKNIFLFLTCCLSIASKMRNDNFKIAKILQLRKPMLKYETKDAFQMECAICEGLQWKMRSLTPICFVDYFIDFLRCRSPVHPFVPRRSVHHTIIKSQGVAASALLTASFRLYPENYDEFKQLILSSEHICMNCMVIY
ncbi:Hypothetical predicted protein [Olea europaea subsp. europaea]|uniref:Cyclin N-terminal domain-containing protein n=1 Tax=Olea europaea subsp. europaea TaxID=158383 RepID=A0A8S0R8N2_OLEEU|nr:Hypothetical predicted protein [Olea europaea subsp. europaea]